MRWVGCVVTDSSKRGKRIWDISRRSLSRRQEKMRVRGWESGSAERAERRAQMAAGLWAASSRKGAEPGMEMRSRRPGQRVVRMPSAMWVAESGNPRVERATAEAMASARLRC